MKKEVTYKLNRYQVTEMLRIFATSGLFRPNKSPDYYEGTAIKALRSMPVKSTYTPTIPKNTGGNGKR